MNDHYRNTSDLLGGDFVATAEQFSDLIADWNEDRENWDFGDPFDDPHVQGYFWRYELDESGDELRVYAYREMATVMTPDPYTDWRQINPDTFYIVVAELVPRESDNTPLEVTVQRRSGYQTHQMQVQLTGVDKLTPKSARAALRIAFGQPYGGTVWAPRMDYGYRVYKNSARKVYPEMV